MMKKDLSCDHFRYYGTDRGYWKHWLLSYELRYLRFLRKRMHCKSRLKKRYYAFRQLHYDRKYGLCILSDQIGQGLHLGHAHNINVAPDVVIGKNCNIAKGASIGQTYRGKKKGSPVIGSRVWIGTGAVVVGGITIGDDVLIAPNAYVTIDIPSHSVVTGNPCSVKTVPHATEHYIGFTV